MATPAKFEYSDRVRELQAEARAANARGDQPGDHRPDVYREDGRWVYRASALGGCPRALWLARQGVDRSPRNKTLDRAMMEGSNSEEIILQMAREKFFLTITDPQYEYEIEVMEGLAIVRGHLDGLGEHTSMDQLGNVEAKALGPDLWKKSATARFKAMPHWDRQVQLGMRGSSRRLTWMLWGQKGEDGVVVDVTYTVVEYSAREVAMALAAVKANEEACANGAHVECPKEEFGCPFWTLHEGKREELEVVQDQKLATLAAKWLRAKAHQAAAKTEVDEAKAAFEKAAEAAKLGTGGLELAGKGQPRTKVKLVERTQRKYDRGLMVEDGVLDKYEYEGTSSYWTVTAIDDEEEG